MKFFLVNDKDPAPIPWKREESLASGTGYATIYYRSTIRILNITPINGEVEKCGRLKEFLEAGNSSSRDEFWSCQVDVGVSTVGSFNMDRSGRLEIIKRKDCLGQLAESFQGATLQVDWSMVVNEAAACTMYTPEMNLRGVLMHQGWNFSCPTEHFNKWRAPLNTILNRMTISVTIPDPIFNTRCRSLPPPSWPMSLTILEKEVLSDVTIVCADGTEIKAHRNFLAACSPVFLAMFQTEMKEARESVLEILDMEAKSVRAFLKLLYSGDTKDAEKDVQVALELFQAGHKYEIKFLEERMRELIVGKPNNWFDLEAVVRIFMFAQNLTPTDEGLKRKMGQVLELYSATLEESPAMQELFHINQKAALELLKYSSMRDTNAR